MTSPTRPDTAAPVALVTGASAGIGAAIVRKLATAGYRLVAVARRQARLEQLAADLAATTAVQTLAIDVAAPDAASLAIALALQHFGRLDCLVNNAGSGKWAAVHKTDDVMLDEVIDTSLKAPFRFCRAAIPHMGSGSSIINIGSTFGLVGGLDGGIYCAVKAGLIGLTQALAVQYGASGIRANLLAPGVVRTDMTEAYWDMPGFQRLNQEMTPFNRDCTTEDVANAVHFLASEQGSIINGQTIALDGGWSTTKYLSRSALTRGLSVG